MKVFLVAALLLAFSYTPVKKYDPGRNADQDIKDAVAEAQKTGKRILLEVGGDWCHWCHIMDDYFDKNPKLTAPREVSKDSRLSAPVCPRYERDASAFAIHR